MYIERQARGRVETVRGERKGERRNRSRGKKSCRERKDSGRNGANLDERGRRVVYIG
jgi:hypothetical protein